MTRAAALSIAALCALPPGAPSAGSPAPERRAEPSPLSARPYPVSVRIVIVPGPGGSVYTRAPGASGEWPPEPHGTANVEEQARAAYEAAAREVFRHVIAIDADVELEVSVAAVDVAHALTGSRAAVEHAIVARAADRTELGRWGVRGTAEFVAGSDGSMANALARAARSAAGQLEPILEQSEDLVRWLKARGIGLRHPPPPPSLRGPYPLTVRIVIAPGAAGSVYTRAAGAGGGWGFEPHGTAYPEVQARAAYEAIARKMFRGVVDGEADLVLRVSVVDADVSHLADRSLASVEHDVSLRTPDGGELGSWRVHGETDFLAGDDQAMANALAIAAKDATRELEAEFEDPPDVARWLRARDIPPRPVAATPGRHRSQSPRRESAPSIFVEGALGSVDYEEITERTSSGRAKGSATSRSLRAGVSGGLLLALSVGQWTTHSNVAVVAQPYRPVNFTGAEFHVTSFGLDVGLAGHVVPALEVLAGAGVERMSGEATVPATSFVDHSTKVVREGLRGVGGSLFAGFRISRCGLVRGVCLRVGGELRRYLSSDLAAFSARMEVAHTLASFTAGVELPWGERSRR